MLISVFPIISSISSSFKYPRALKTIPAFITTYEVVADNPSDALAYAREIEPVEVRESMTIRSHEELGAYPDNEQGVYWRNPYGFYQQTG